MKYYYLMAIILVISFANSQDLIEEDYDVFLKKYSKPYSKDSAEYQ